jgi:hypothetical protein
VKLTRWYTRKDTGEQFRVEIEIDTEELAAEVAARAIANKSGRASKCGRAVRAAVVERRPKA